VRWYSKTAVQQCQSCFSCLEFRLKLLIPAHIPAHCNDFRTILAVPVAICAIDSYPDGHD
jgi:hypothetical protein